MRTIKKEYNVYTFDELNEKAKEKARDWYKLVFDFDFHAECVLDDAKEAAKILGIKIDNIYYSGFSSQGDGACFTGQYRYQKDALKKIKEYAPQDKKLHDIAILLGLTKGILANISHRGNYYHSGCMNIECDVEEDTKITASEEDNILKDALIGFANWIYRRLEKEYEYQNSNEAIDENIQCNEYEFLEDGRIA